MSEPSRQERVQALSGTLLETISQAAVERTKLEQVRAERTASPERVADAAMSFRKADDAVKGALVELVDLQVKLLHEVAGTSPGGR